MALLPFNDDSSGFQQIVRKRGPADSRATRRGELPGPFRISAKNFDRFFSYSMLLLCRKKMRLHRIASSPIRMYLYKYHLKTRDPSIELMRRHNERVAEAYYSCYLAVNQSWKCKPLYRTLVLSSHPSSRDCEISYVGPRCWYCRNKCGLAAGRDAIRFCNPRTNEWFSVRVREIAFLIL